MQINQSTFIITGASSGLGEATARMLHAQGANVVIADINTAAGEKLAAELGARAAFHKTDVTIEQDGRNCVNLAAEKFGGLSGLVNCAGIGMPEKVLGKSGPHPLDIFTRIININLIGTFNMTRLAAELISKREPGASGERGVIISTASVAAYDGQIGQAAYAASKAGVAGMTLPIARELARFGIRVVTIAPGLFETPMMAALPKDVQDALGRSVPFPPRLGLPDEYAALVRHIAENQMLNGEVIRLDGALRMAPR
jgi:NAD(P)-dependent dehydrogenase (short-subunit alcohol dehydrogenase family)